MPEKQSAVGSEFGEDLLNFGARGYDKTTQYKIA